MLHYALGDPLAAAAWGKIFNPQQPKAAPTSAKPKSKGKEAAWDPNQRTMLGHSTGAKGVQGRIEQHFHPVPKAPPTSG